MPHVPLSCPPDEVFDLGFSDIRREFEISVDFPADAATEASSTMPLAIDRRDARELDLVTIDPPGSRDLDQAFTAQRNGSGYVVRYAIADVGAFVAPGGAVDREAHRRGVTFYAPDRNAPLHPDSIGAGHASLLPDQDTPSVLWTIALDHSGAIVDATVERAVVRSRLATTYREVAASLSGADPDERYVLLREIGELRLAAEEWRGGVSLNLPAQEVVDTGDHYDIVYRDTLPVEGWNAQISLLTGMAAAAIMLDGGVGILRTLPQPTDGTIDWLRRTSNALSVSFPKAMTYPEWVRSLDTSKPTHVALQYQAARAFRGAGYVGFDGEAPEEPEHAALAAPYAHVTAPLRRMVDRYCNEIVLALCAGRRPPGWALEMLERVPEEMAEARRRAAQFEKALVDFTEVQVLSYRIGERFEATVTDRRDERITIQLTDPAVVTRIRDGRPALGRRVTVELDGADPATRTLDFTVVV